MNTYLGWSVSLQIPRVSWKLWWRPGQARPDCNGPTELQVAQHPVAPAADQDWKLHSQEAHALVLELYTSRSGLPSFAR